MLKFNLADRSKYMDSLMMLYKEIPVPEKDKDILDGKTNKVADSDRKARTPFINAVD